MVGIVVVTRAAVLIARRASTLDGRRTLGRAVARVCCRRPEQPGLATPSLITASLKSLVAVGCASGELMTGDPDSGETSKWDGTILEA
jgi:hypothetical protein